MKFEPIDVSQWKRKEYFDHYFHQFPCTYSMTLNLDITSFLSTIKKKNIKLYPAIIHLLATVVNRHEEFRTAIDQAGNLGIFDLVSPSYTLFQKESETFTNVWTEYHPVFSTFYSDCLADIEKYGDIREFIAKPHPPLNLFYISSIPWVAFTGFNLYLPRATDFLLPIFTTGKYFQQNGQTLLPISIQVHHAVCDGFHIARLVSELQTLLYEFEND